MTRREWHCSQHGVERDRRAWLSERTPYVSAGALVRLMIHDRELFAAAPDYVHARFSEPVEHPKVSRMTASVDAALMDVRLCP